MITHTDDGKMKVYTQARSHIYNGYLQFSFHDFLFLCLHPLDSVFQFLTSQSFLLEDKRK